MRIPLATYRIQFSPAFTFQDAKAIASYLAELGISDLYASPVFQSRKGSTHGYDVVNPNQINTELGGPKTFENLVQELQNYGLGWVQDIVPNHMAFDSQNQMLVDVLENGPDSQYKDYFDINWEHPYEGIRGRVLAPFLGKFCGDCLESGELQLQYEERGLTINYYGLKFPIRIESYIQVLTHELGQLRQKLGRKHPDFVKLLGALYALKYIPSGEEGRERYDQITFIKGMVWELWSENPDIREFIQESIKIFNGEPGNPESFNLLESLLAEQFFRLSYWKVGNEELNYRRFFTVNDLISMRVEDERVFEHNHSLIFKLIDTQEFTGLRIDHIDGLYDPAQYLHRLRERVPDAYITVEKILERHEELPLNWPVQGTTGYDFLNQVNGIFCQQATQEKFNSVYHRFIGNSTPYETLVDDKKRLIIGKHLTGDIDNLANLLKHLSGLYRYASDFTIYALKGALVEIMAVFPVYRTYISAEGSSKADRECIQQVITKARENTPVFLNELNFIEKFLLQEFDESLTQEEKEQQRYFAMRLQQFTGPLMAKGVEDTVLYIYNRLVSLNEVGSNPGEFGVSVDEFHSFNHHRAAYWPHTTNASSTHDTKRGEDIRARINVLSEIPGQWENTIRKWQEINGGHKECVEGLDVPDPNDEYFFYQTLLGTYPFYESEYPAFVGRIKEYIIKAIREAKVHTAWLRPDTGYEDGFIQFAERLLKDSEDNEFLQAFRPFQRRIQHYGIFNSLSQTLLKLTSPGVPDFYQGTELWDLSLVDPDNRRPVDFEQCIGILRDFKNHIETDYLGLIQELLETPEDGRIKLFLIYQALQTRREYLELFQRGDYEKLTVIGSLRDHIVAFARHWDHTTIMAIAPRFLTSLIKEGEHPLGEQVWQETRLSLPPGASSTWYDAMSGQEVQGDDTLWIRDVLKHFPVALLINKGTAD
ncbi:malto-oligosyltrehalose synthase [Coleofasciculus sp. LEGE 07081]|uniref:malto-oligosyltrehalose synthase n=2 Tax=Bacillati TaxID=1783272 RepID=UPI00187E8AF2|nr:malto-oligosyltrehalose synthase [Coleofasciculus sp. LEGE 07081]MBE9148466.1 malto-oligosyltrehalose synthase [Coleofasciculus sp. LEGE 07092]